MDIQLRRDYIQEVKGLLSGCYARGGGGDEEEEEEWSQSEDKVGLRVKFDRTDKKQTACAVG